MKILIIDTSAILSGKPIVIENAKIVTTPGVLNELKPGGKDYQNFQFLIEKGLTIETPSEESIREIQKTSNETGDITRLSKADIEILALARDIIKNKKHEPVILTDDYSIQNIANVLKIRFENISQNGIQKRFKWGCRCRGCGREFKEKIKICPVCGTETKNIISEQTDLEKT